MDYLPADYIRLEMCILPHNTSCWITCACKCMLRKCIRVTQDTVQHVAQIVKSVQLTTASCKKGSFMECLFSTNFSLKTAIAQRTLSIFSKIM